MGDEKLLAARTWRDNGELIAAVFKLLERAGLYREGEPVADLTYGEGIWWKDYRPSNFHPLSRGAIPDFDFRIVPFPTASVMVTAFDPPYCGKGGRDTSGVKEMDARYGLDDSPEYARHLLMQNIAGLMEALRITEGAVLLKSMEFCEGGVFHRHTTALEQAAVACDWAVYDRLVHVPSGARPQPLGRAKKHAEDKPSMLTILVPHKHRRGRKRK